jgi:hypothetical protein
MPTDHPTTGHLLISGHARPGTAAVTLAALLLAASGCVTVTGRSATKAVVEAKFAAVNRHSIADIAALYAADASLTAADFCSPRQGRADVERTYSRLFGDVPDITTSDHEYLVQGNRVAVKYHVSGHVQGNAFDVPIMNVFTVKDGLITRDEGIFDTRGRKCSP